MDMEQEQQNIKNIDKVIIRYLLINSLKRLGIRCLAVAVIIIAIGFCYSWFIGSYLVPNYAGECLSRMMSSLINMPYQTQMAEYRNSNNDLVKITDHDWQELKCIKTFGLRKNRGQVVENKAVGGSLSKQEQQDYAECIRIHYFDGYKQDKFYLLGRGTDEINDRFCTHPMTCDLISLGVGDYVLQKPEILRNLIKIAERPCNYIKKYEEITQAEIDEWEGRYGNNKGEGRKYLEYKIKSNNRDLYCKKPNFLEKRGKRFVEINIMNSRTQDNDIRIYVIRKDI